MARSFHFHGLQPRLRSARSTRQAAMLLLLLLMAAVAALWVAGEPVTSLLPVDPPA